MIKLLINFEKVLEYRKMSIDLKNFKELYGKFRKNIETLEVVKNFEDIISNFRKTSNKREILKNLKIFN